MNYAVRLGAYAGNRRFVSLHLVNGFDLAIAPKSLKGFPVWQAVCELALARSKGTAEFSSLQRKELRGDDAGASLSACSPPSA